MPSAQFTGQYTHNLDSKDRLTIPAAFKEYFRTGVVLSPGVDGCVWAYTPETWEAFAEKLNALPNDKEGRKLKRIFFNNTKKDALDKSGRVTIPSHLKNHAGITKTVVVTGTYDKLEIWSAEAWAAMGNTEPETFDDAYDLAAAKGLL